MPCPSRRPHNDQAVDPDDEGHAHCNQYNAPVFDTISFAHTLSSASSQHFRLSLRSFDSAAGALNLILSPVSLSGRQILQISVTVSSVEPGATARPHLCVWMHFQKY